MTIFNKTEWKGHDADALLMAVARDRLTNLYAFVRDDEAFRGITITCKGERAYLAVLKRFGDDGTPEVCFASGINFWDLFLGMNAALSKGDWRTDKFEKQRIVKAAAEAKKAERGS